MRNPAVLLVLTPAILSLCHGTVIADDTPPAEVLAALEQAGENKAELIKARGGVPRDQLKGLDFLIANMPEKDLRSLTAEFLIENVTLAYKARDAVRWGKDIPEEIFLNHVLPYANVNEERDPWRKQFFEMCLPLVKDCETPGEAAQKLNSTVFKELKVVYSTKRSKADQSPKESIEQGMASCTGLSIVLSDACRSVAVPARLVGIARWVDVPGNHTWVEIWDGRWHFTGACEPSPKGLDDAWFTARAAKAKKDSRLNAIYAASFRKTGLTFPLVWARDARVPAENVTDHYTGNSGSLSAGLSNEQTNRIKEAVADYFRAPAEQRADWKFDPNLDQWLGQHPGAVRRIVWEAYRDAPIHADAKKEFDENQVRHEEYLSPYTIKTVGERPENGWPLFIAMHGGGNAPKRVNDSQWEVMQRYYRDQESVKGYKYLALRAPNDTWNGFYDHYVPPLIENLIGQFLLFGDVDPDKVYLMGYSHGGYGAFYIGPKIPHRFAAVHVSAAAPTDGTISARTLRNTRFTFMIGENDNAYGRRERCEAFAKQVAELKAENEGAYPVEMEFKEGFGHGGLPDRDKIKQMYPHTRNPVPKHLTWDLTDDVNHDFYWLSVAEPKPGTSIDAVIEGNAVAITTKGVERFSLRLDERLVDPSRPVTVTVNGEERSVAVEPRVEDLCESLARTGDPALAFSRNLSLGGE